MYSIFISYSHDSKEHIQWTCRLVEDLNQKLIESPISIVFDQTHLKPGMDIARFMEQGISEAEYVLVICTSSYNKKADKGYGGAGYEKMIITSKLIADQDTQKFIPLIRNVDEQRSTPLCLSTRLFINLSDGTDYEKALTSICEVIGITNKPNKDSSKKGWSFDEKGKDLLIKGEKREFNHPDGRRETFLLIENDVVCVEQEFPWGVKSYYEMDKNGNIIKQIFPYPVSEYHIVTNQEVILSKRQTINIDGNIENETEMKWGRSVRWMTKANGELLDYHVLGGYNIDHKSKEIRCGW